jgi:hypothetical protein
VPITLLLQVVALVHPLVVQQKLVAVVVLVVSVLSLQKV